MQAIGRFGFRGSGWHSPAPPLAILIDILEDTNIHQPDEFLAVPAGLSGLMTTPGAIVSRSLAHRSGQLFLAVHLPSTATV